ncbi:ATP-dependent DNA helicase PIF4-like [Olea europaea var. sylvestris]|uniref:ATP-dependent DNA helicase PIF4-like n=1 Tax=Olea europaea var. sylvestris TaxID=158386 RepID=UPI000C1CD1FE|nr:ATP-dependent DNA helicase PIF4-like [Olea europaea var. sylvestris]
MTVCDAEIRALRCINSFLDVFGININDFGLVDFDVIVNDADVLANMILEETTNINVQYFSIGGPGGTGKTFLYKALVAVVRSRQLIALATVSSGVAASLMPAGRTGHKRFKILLQASSDMRCSVSKQSSLGQLLQMTKLIVWDEPPMINRCAFEALDKMLKDITECELPFGGKVVVFGGDFRQVLSVVQRGTKDDIMKKEISIRYHLRELNFSFVLVLQ